MDYSQILLTEQKRAALKGQLGETKLDPKEPNDVIEDTYDERLWLGRLFIPIKSERTKSTYGK